MLETKDMRKLILIAITAFMLGFALLILYYFNYASETAKRDKTALEAEILNAASNSMNSAPSRGGEVKFGETDKSYKYTDNDMKKYVEYSEDVLKLETSKTEEETNKIFDDTMLSIRIKAFAGNFDDAATIAFDAMGSTVFVDGTQFSSLSAIRNIGGFTDMSPSDQRMIIGNIKDPVVFVALFYATSKSTQADILGDENFLMVPIFEDNPASLISVKEVGKLTARANEYFSNLEDVTCTEVKISVNGIIYNVYVSGKDNYSYKITNIEFEENSVDYYNNYTDYFNVWGRD